MTDNDSHISFTDKEFIRLFERRIDLPYAFSHTAHLRLAWLCLDQFGEEAGFRICKKWIQSYVEYVGAEDKYHETITRAAFKLIVDRQRTTKSKNWKEFLQTNPKLVKAMPELLTIHYSPDVLHSDLARKSYIPPDKKPFD